MADLDLTLGFEFEFVCIFEKYVFTRELGVHGYKPYEGIEIDNIITAGHAMQIVFEQASIPVTGWEDPDVMIIHVSESYTKWRIDEDTNFLSEGEQVHLPEGYRCESIELASPKFHLTENWQGDLDRLFKALHEMERYFKCHFILNKSTGFHVHVGNNTQPLPFKTCKNLFQLVTAHEQTLDSAHSADRINTISELISRQVPPCFAPPSFFLHRADPTRRDPTIFSRLQQIERDAVDFPSLGQLFHHEAPISHGHASAYNFDNCFHSDEEDEKAPKTGTIEFRQHGGTFDLPSIFAWTDVVTHLVLFSHCAPLPKFLQILVSSTEPATDVGQYKLTSFLREIGCAPETVEHYYSKESGERDAHWGVIGDLFSGLNLGVSANTDEEEEDQRMDGLVEINDEEQTFNAASEAVQAKILRKFQDLDYGLDPTAAPIRISEDVVEDLYREACAELRGMFTPAELDGFTLEEKYAMAKAIFFDRMHEMYSASDGALAGHWEAIERERERE